MTAEEFIRKKRMEMAESQNKKNLIKLVDYSKEAEIAEAYLNSQRETIFKEELEERLDGFDEVIKHHIRTGTRYPNGESSIDEETFYEGAKWLIQYLKK